LLPAFDAAATLPACLASIRRQTFTDWECVVVDDGSRDDTPDILAAAAAEDDRILPVRTPHRGLVAALTTGLARCRGAFVARMDADDIMHRRRLATQARALVAAPALAGVGCRVRLFPRAALGDGWRRYERWLNAVDAPERVRAEAFVECPIAHPTLMVRRAVLERFGYRDAGWPEDYDLVLRLLAAREQLHVVPERLLAWRHHPDRVTANAATCSLERITACKAAFLADGLLAGSDDYVLWGFGGTGRALHRALLAHGKRPSHVVEVHAGRLGNVIHGAPVIPWERLAGLPRRPVVASVVGIRPRQQIRAALAGLGMVETVDFVCAA
jgi:glycosyltransferase involved in cell wall biosynthesis